MDSIFPRAQAAYLEFLSEQYNMSGIAKATVDLVSGDSNAKENLNAIFSNVLNVAAKAVGKPFHGQWSKFIHDPSQVKVLQGMADSFISCLKTIRNLLTFVPTMLLRRSETEAWSQDLLSLIHKSALDGLSALTSSNDFVYSSRDVQTIRDAVLGSLRGFLTHATPTILKTFGPIVEHARGEVPCLQYVQH
jgi:hypothetical protein